MVQSRVSGGRDLLRPAMSAEDKAMAMLEFLGITRIAYEDGHNLSYGQKKLIDLAALLMSDPKSSCSTSRPAASNRSLVEAIVGHIRTFNENDLTVLIVEHNMDLIMRLSRRVVVMAQGQVICSGMPDAVRRDPQLLEAYLGSVLKEAA